MTSPSLATSLGETSVFISYAHGSPSFQTTVCELAQFLEEKGIIAIFDQTTRDPVKGWRVWSKEQVQAARQVIILMTPAYARRYEGQQANGGYGAAWEARLIARELYESPNENTKYRVVLFDRSDFGCIPAELRDFRTYLPWESPSEMDALVHWLRESQSENAPEPDTSNALPARRSRTGPIRWLCRVWPIIALLPMGAAYLAAGEAPDVDKTGKTLPDGWRRRWHIAALLSQMERADGGPSRVVIGNIGHIKPEVWGGPGEWGTPAAPLQEVVTRLVSLRPKAIGVDIDFSAENGKPGHPSHPAFVDWCHTFGSQHNVPIYLGVYRNRAAPAATYLPGTDLGAIAASLSIPRAPMLQAIFIPSGVSQPLPSLSARLAGWTARKAPSGLGWAFTAERSRSTLNGVTVEYLVDYTRMNMEIIEVASAASLGGQSGNVEGKIVLLGDAASDSTDKFNLEGIEAQPVAGVQLHGCGVNTLMEGGWLFPTTLRRVALIAAGTALLALVHPWLCILLPMLSLAWQRWVAFFFLHAGTGYLFYASCLLLAGLCKTVLPDAAILAWLYLPAALAARFQFDKPRPRPLR